MAHRAELAVSPAGESTPMRGLPCAAIDFSRVDQNKTVALRDWLLARPDAAVLQPACAAWLRHRVGTHLACSPVLSMLALLRLLRAAGVGAGQLVVCTAAGADPGSACREIVDVIETIFDEPPRLMTTSARRGRPDPHLLLSAPAHSKPDLRRCGAALSLCGLHALMLAACVWLMERAHGPQ
jgi:hypothetical protein